jgi:hypothetical protein
LCGTPVTQSAPDGGDEAESDDGSGPDDDAGEALEISARIGDAPPDCAVARVVLGGALAMPVTFGIGQLVGAVGI